MALTNYGELKTSVANWVHRTDLDAVIPDFITMASARINNDLKSVFMEKRVAATITTEYSELPTDMVEIRNVKINSEIINFYTQDQIVQGGYDSSTGSPAIYTIVANQIRVIGAPNSAELEIVYYAMLSALSADTDTNIVIDNYPQLYMYATMLEYAIYAEEDERVPVLGRYYSDSVERINNANDKVRYPSGSLAVRAV